MRLGKPLHRFDQPWKRFSQAIYLTLGQTKVLQSFSLKRDRAGIAHAFILWGFLLFVFSYLVFIFGDSVSDGFSHSLLTKTGIRIVTYLIEAVAIIFLIVMAWAFLRRWVAKPSRLRFAITRSTDSVVILGLTSILMVTTLIAEAFYFASNSNGSKTIPPLGTFIGKMFQDAGLGSDTATQLYTTIWWGHLALILCFGIYIPWSKHIHILGSPIAFFFRDLEPGGKLSTPNDLEIAPVLGSNRIQDFTWKELLDGYACAVCGRCTDSCPASISEKTLSPMHVVEDIKEHLLETGPEALNDENTEPIIGTRITAEALWDCLTCGACEQVCPAGVEHIDPIIGMRRNLVMEQASMPATAAGILTNLEKRLRKPMLS